MTHRKGTFCAPVITKSSDARAAKPPGSIYHPRLLRSHAVASRKRRQCQAASGRTWRRRTLPGRAPSRGVAHPPRGCRAPEGLRLCRPSPEIDEGSVIKPYDKPSVVSSRARCDFAFFYDSRPLQIISLSSFDIELGMHNIIAANTCHAIFDFACDITSTGLR